MVVQPATQGASGFNVRGFGTNASTLSNGLSDPNSYKTNVAGVERIEVLKGPQALLAGANGLGGTLNIVTKKPTTERIRDVSSAMAAMPNAPAPSTWPAPSMAARSSATA